MQKFVLRVCCGQWTTYSDLLINTLGLSSLTAFLGLLNMTVNFMLGLHLLLYSSFKYVISVKGDITSTIQLIAD